MGAGCPIRILRWPDGTYLVDPTGEEIEQKIGWMGDDYEVTDDRWVCPDCGRDITSYGCEQH